MSVTVYQSAWHNIPEDTDLLVLLYVKWVVMKQKKKKKWQEVPVVQCSVIWKS
jgi:hypothetical protein